MLSNYPSGHPYYASSTDESLEELAKVKLDDVKKYYHDFYGANNSVSSFVGELDKKQIKSFLESSFGKWNSKETYKEVEPIYFESKAKTETINTPDKTNAMLLGGIKSEYLPQAPGLCSCNYSK